MISGSFYLAARDGTRLAVYLFRPEAAERVPVLWSHNRYHTGQPRTEDVRAWLDRYRWLRGEGSDDPLAGILGKLEGLGTPERGAEIEAEAPARVSLDALPWLSGLIERGYAIALVDARGTGASFGAWSGPFSPEEADDAADVTAWLAAQPWSSGAIGMFGRSYMGASQYHAAVRAPAIAALFPEMAPFELYGFVYPGGVFRHGFGRKWSDDLAARDRVDAIAPLDDDPDGVALAQARAEHAGNQDSYEAFLALPYRDSRDAATGAQPFLERSPSALAAAGHRPRAPVCLLAGWNDAFVRDALLWYHNAAGPRRLVIGPWAHTGSVGFDMLEQHAQWYDRWLKGAAPAAEEPPIYYYTVGAPHGERWRSTETWPPPGVVPTPFHLRSGRAGSCGSKNDGRLTEDAPAPDERGDDYEVDPTTTTGTASRWANACGGPFDYPDLAANDARALTYTTAPLAAAMELTGHPIVRLWIHADAPDVDVFAYLEEVSDDGRSHYVTEGTLRASHRALHEPPLEYLGLPYHRSYAEDVAPLPAEPVELVFDMHPISRQLAAGSRIRLAITGADRDNARSLDTPVPPRLHVHHDASRPSRVILPVVPRPTIG